MWKNRKKEIAFLLSICIFLQICPINTIKTFAQATITMTEYYNEGKYGKSLSENCIVTISNVLEMKQFRECIKDNKTEGIFFKQTDNIYFDNATFDYDEESERIKIMKHDQIIGALDANKNLFENLSSNNMTSYEKIGLSDIILENLSGMFDTIIDDWLSTSDVFRGSYDGQGYEIGGFILHRDNTSSSSGFFGCSAKEAIIKNIVFTDALFANLSGGIIANINHGTIQQCTVQRSSAIYGKGSGDIGMFVGKNAGLLQACNSLDNEIIIGEENGGSVIGGITSMNSGQIVDSEVKNTLLSAGEEGYAGGIAGECILKKQDIQILNCNSEANIKGRDDNTLGGIVGTSSTTNDEYDDSASLLIKGCYFHGTLLSDTGLQLNNCGGIAGELNTENTIVDGCYNTGNITLTARSTGGIVGNAKSVIINRCFNSGDILTAPLDREQMSPLKYGGIIGDLDSGQILNSANMGSVFEKLIITPLYENMAGGIVGYISDSFLGSIKNSYNLGDVMGDIAGGLVGNIHYSAADISQHNLIENCVSLGRVGIVEGYDCYSGILGGSIYSGGFANCYYIEDTARPIVGNDISKKSCKVTDCYPVSRAQTDGTETEKLISSESNFASVTNLIDALNQWIKANTKEDEPTLYQNWKKGTTKYPLLGIEAGEYIGIAMEIPIISVPEAVETPPAHDIDNNSSKDKLKNALQIKNLKAKTTTNLSVKLTWQRNQQAEGYIIYRSLNKTSGYQKIGNVNGTKQSYTDKKAKKGKNYYYKISAYTSWQEKMLYGADAIISINIPWYIQPDIRLEKGVLENGQHYIQIILKSVQGTNIEIYIKTKGKDYQKVKLKSSKLSDYNNKIRLAYSKKNVVIYCKVRTYKKVDGKKRYSAYSKEKKINL